MENTNQFIYRYTPVLLLWIYFDTVSFSAFLYPTASTFQYHITVSVLLANFVFCHGIFKYSL